MSKLKFWLLALSFVFVTGSAFSDPPVPSHFYWQNSNYFNHYVLYDFASHDYIETVDCKIYWHFKVVTNQLNTLTLFDASRGMTMQLTYDGMYLKPKGATAFTFYQKGTFDTRTQFSHYDQNNTYTGALTKQHACGWVEYLSGATSPTWRFNQIGWTPGYVDLYDGGRNMLVRLNKDSMYLRTGTNPLAFFKKGHW